MDRTITLNNVLDDLREYLLYQDEEGIEQAEVSQDVMKAFGKLGSKSPPKVSERRQPAPAPAGQPAETDRPLDQIASEIAACTRCALHKTRTNTVPGQGDPHPEIMFIGEGPGADEDQQGLAFVGRAGQLLTKMIGAMGYTREKVFIGNIVKCRPPGNRVPLPEEMETCLPYLKRQIAILKPKVIVALGATAVKSLLGTGTGITKLRGEWHRFEEIDLMPTFHPAYLLRSPSKKREAWEDLQEVLARLGKKPPPLKTSQPNLLVRATRWQRKKKRDRIRMRLNS